MNSGENAFSFDSEYLRAFYQATGTGPRDAIRTLRPGGPLDDSKFLTHCLLCGVKRAETPRWFLARDYRCRCGGEFYVEPLMAIACHARLALSLIKEGAPAAQVAAVKEGWDLLQRTFFQPIQDDEQ